ncbi:hypothetical protein GCM10009430_06600 [Aquimarina litoralis]|uniref:Thioredoxin domain-containing protein n=1 Tax=Aquimarina litoralis TaxID=584605 RepID=A0ABP3TSD2_9FLAO
MNSRKLYFLFLIICFSCNKEESTKTSKNTSIVVDLIKKTGNGPFGNVLQPFSDIDSLPKNFKGVPELTYYSPQFFGFNSRKKMTALLEKKLIDSTEYAALTNRIYGISGLDGDSQIMILDMNHNFDFSDDEVYVFDAELRKKTGGDAGIRDSFPLLHLKYKRYYKNKIRDRDQYVRLIPYKDYFYSDKDISDATKRYYDLLLVAARSEHLLGNFSIEKDSFRIAAELYDEDVDFIFAEKGNPFYSRRNMDKYEEFEKGDTLQLGSHFIKIDSVGAALDKVYLKTLDITSLPHGYKRDQTLRDYAFTDIEGNKKRISHLLNDKDLLLIDFWGTWCVPCLKLTPDLKEFHKSYPNVAMLGIDFDFEKEPGIQYIKEKELDWTHMFVERVRNDSLLHTKIVSKLRVDNYPTFMLIDKDLKILYRGVGKKGLNRTIELIETINALEAQRKN